MSSINDHIDIKGNKVFLDDVDLFRIAEKYGAPIFVFSEKKIAENVETLYSLANHYVDDTVIFYAFKANSNINILRKFREMGILAEVVSHGELYKAFKAGYEASEIVFNGPGKYIEGLEVSVRKGLHCINIDSEYEMDLVRKLSKKYGMKTRVAMRIVPEVEAQVIETGLSWTKFGLEIEKAMNMYIDAAGDPNLDPVGIHSHLGSQILELDTWREGTSALVGMVNQLYSRGIKLEHINMGGGFPNDYTVAPVDLNMDVPSGFKPRIREGDIFRTIATSLNGLKYNMRLYLELGRRLIADTAILLTRVINYKTRSNGEKWLILDSGFNILLSTVLYKWYYPMVNLSKIDKPHTYPFRVGGPLCDTDDAHHDLEGELRGEPHLPRYRLLPKDTEPGDILMILHVGAYTMEEASNYNSLPRPPMVAITENRDVKLIRRRETIEEMIQREIASVVDGKV